MSLIRASIYIFSKWNWNEHGYHVKDNSDFGHSGVKMSCNSTQFSELKFCGPHTKPYGVSGLSNNDHFSLDDKLVQGICEIQQIQCAHVACKAMLYKLCSTGVSNTEQPHYQTVLYWTYCPVLGSFNN